ncbi:MAG: phosphoribosylglycinamide formyltransferase [Moraxellaceae bacterium]|nr:MAG: phosphoribosylglycinamide formyltransferase [Moraxellaceae bacterium]
MPHKQLDSPSIVVLISGSGSNLQAIIDGIEAGNIAAKITAVISNKQGVQGLVRAEKHGIANYVLDHTKHTDREDYDQALKNLIDQHNPDLIILAGFMRILTDSFVQHYHGKMLNIHPSLLPKFKGLHTHRRAIEAKETEHGCSVHFVTPELDGGPIIAQRKVAIAKDDTETTLATKIQKEEHVLYPLCTKLFAEGRLLLTNSGPTLDGITIIEGGLDLTDTNEL